MCEQHKDRNLWLERKPEFSILIQLPAIFHRLLLVLFIPSCHVIDALVCLRASRSGSTVEVERANQNG